MRRNWLQHLEPEECAAKMLRVPGARQQATTRWLRLGGRPERLAELGQALPASELFKKLAKTD
jgi:hypothetical protein